MSVQIKGKARTTGRILGTAIAVLAVTHMGGASAGGISASTSFIRVSKTGCGATANDMRSSCRSEALAEYWLALGKAKNLETPKERKAASAEAAADLREALADCSDQREARLELCSALGEDIYDPEIDPKNFDAPVANPLFPLVPGTEWTYEETNGPETNTVTVLNETRELLGVQCVVVHDVVFENGDLIEDTRDYYAMDNLGNVWYFGENSLEIEDGIVVGTGGSWIAGEEGAKPGIVMLAAPAVGDVYRQEFALSVGEDSAEVVSTTANLTVPFGAFSNCLQTEDFTPIEPDNREQKSYAAGVGVIREIDLLNGDEVVLVGVTN